MSNESRKIWVLPPTLQDKEIAKYPKEYSDLVPILVKREISPKILDSFLEPQLSGISSFEKLHDSKKAANQIIDAIKANKKIFIHGDFDADGICATSILWEFIHRELAPHLGVEVSIMPYIPSRVDEGYGLSEKSVDAMIDLGAELIISVDCGVRDKELIQKYMSKSDIEFIITDHHLPPDDLLDGLNYTIVHQLYPDHEYPEGAICGSTIAFLLTCAMRELAGLDSEIKPDTSGLDLVALATVTDIMPLKGANRVFVKYGLDQMRKGKRLGIAKLCEVASVKPELLDSYHLGFVIGPRINAAGRIGNALDAVRLLLTDDSAAAIKRANELNSLNFKRQELTQTLMNDAMKQIEQTKGDILNFVVGEGWPEGIVGLVAGKVQESTGHPTIVATINNGEIRGSARSLNGFNITEAIGQFHELLEKYGGHEQAAGFTVIEGKLEEFISGIKKYANEQVNEDDLVQELRIDLVISTDQLKIPLINKLDLLKPFGYKNNKPVVMIENAVVVDKLVMGKEKCHLKMTVKDKSIGTISAVMFNCTDDIEKLKVDDIIDLAGSVGINEWNGNVDVQFIINEWRYSNGSK